MGIVEIAKGLLEAAKLFEERKEVFVEIIQLCPTNPAAPGYIVRAIEAKSYGEAVKAAAPRSVVLPLDWVPSMIISLERAFEGLGPIKIHDGKEHGTGKGI